MLLAGCAVQRAVVAQGAQEKMVGLSKEQVLACMGPPGKMAEGATEVWSYSSGNDRVTAIGSGYSQTNGSLSGQRTRGGGFSADGTATTVSLSSATASRRYCTVNVVMSDGLVSRINYTGPTGGLLTGGEQCAFAVENCTR
jgi:outer membrane protein assembly factor BamE (lipoprotein component of BamABCDE complex)